MSSDSSLPIVAQGLFVGISAVSGIYGAIVVLCKGRTWLGTDDRRAARRGGRLRATKYATSPSPLQYNSIQIQFRFSSDSVQFTFKLPMPILEGINFTLISLVMVFT
ncbi:hypothetical protein ACN38_g8178 [Penicillium nordicum]|uniref:Uncharacterized protein n=1 Tax=Penicillium nordicum TaxID=229535 RepID=A0A0M9WDZ2_9EURO|nr:hypothetical protein ACN38_g8178 [Penicillium nordicum]